MDLSVQTSGVIRPDNTMLWVVIGILTAALLVAVVVIVLIARKNKK